MMGFISCIFLLPILVGCVQSAEVAGLVLGKVGESITLTCKGVEPEEQFGSYLWLQNSVIMATIGENMEVNYPIDSFRGKIVVNTDGRLKLVDLEMKDAGNYTCKTIFMITNTTSGGVEFDEKLNKYMLKVQDVPSAMDKPQLGDIESRQVTVSWSPSTNDNNSPVTAYVLHVRECLTTGGDRNKDVEAIIVLDMSLSTVVSELRPFTCYTITVSARNAIGTSRPSRPSDEFYTEQEDNTADNSTTLFVNSSDAVNVTIKPPEAAPYNFKAMSLSSSEIKLQWKRPPDHLLNGQLIGYQIHYGTESENLKPLRIEDPDRTSTVLQGLAPYQMYTVSIKAYNGAGYGPEAAMGVETLEGAPSKPRITHISSRQSNSFCVNWEPPKVLNGHLIRYELQWIHNNISKSRVIAGHLINPMTAFIQGLTPYTQYQVQVAAETNGGRGEFSDHFPALTDVSAPGAPSNLNVTERGPTTIYLTWDSPRVYYKGVDNYLIKGWDHRGRDLKELVRGHLTECVLTDLHPNSRYHLKVAAITNAIFSTTKWVGDFTEPMIFTLGAYAGGNEIWDRTADTSLTDEGNNGSIHPGVIAGIVLSIVVLVIVVVLVVGYRWYTCRKCYQAAIYLAVPSNGPTVQSAVIPVEEPSGEKQYPDIPVGDFLSHVSCMHTDSDIAFSQEFDEINRTSFIDKYPCDSSNSPDNRNKNRYINIVAYDHSRVMLKTELGRLRQSDYINANYVDGYKKSNAYIATQGPLPQTFSDFWRMVWEQNTSVIVMITNLMEKGRRKCDQYWPNDGVETYGNIQVKLITTVPRAHYTVHVFSLKNLKVKKRHSMKAAAERTVYHYHYTEWPDHGVPDYCLPVLSFVQKSAAQSGPEHGPIIVHCSAGVGRTGTYILIDSMIAQIQDKKSINIPGFTQHIRRQRNFLVQTEDQYIFIHSVLVEYLLGGGSTEVKEEQLSQYLSLLRQPVRGLILPSITGSTLLERQLQLITEYSPSDQDFSAAIKPFNREKNREGSILPVNLKRVLLPARPGVEGSDYINATYLQGYKKSSEFLVTQHPTEETMEDFWRMVWDKNSPIIVVLSTFDDIDYKEFWPPKGSSIEVDAGNFRLAMKDEPIPDEEQGFTTYEFILDSIQYDYTLMTRILCINNWPGSCTDLHRVFDSISHAQSYLNSLECGPIVVMDRFGGVEAGQFCALWTLRDQMLSEKCADFYQVAKLYHYKRPGIVGKQEDYLFLHCAMSEFCTNLLNEHLSNGSSPRHHHHFEFFSHHGSTRRNGTLPRGNSNAANSNNSSTLPRVSTHIGRSSSAESYPSTNNVPSPTGDSAKVETNI